MNLDVATMIKIEDLKQIKLFLHYKYSFSMLFTTIQLETYFNLVKKNKTYLLIIIKG